jgi:hypothetical protein
LPPKNKNPKNLRFLSPRSFAPKKTQRPCGSFLLRVCPLKKSKTLRFLSPNILKIIKDPPVPFSKHFENNQRPSGSFLKTFFKIIKEPPVPFSKHFENNQRPSGSFLQTF